MQKQNGKDLLAGMLLARREDGTMQYLYEQMYGRPMPSAEQSKAVGNVVPFPKQLSLGLRRKILRDAMQQLENVEK